MDKEKANEKELVTKNYKILKLTSENFKKIKFVEITPVDNLVIISGQNGSGKTSVLDSIFYALCGADSKNLKKPIHDGAEYAKINIDLGDYIVTRNWTSDDKSTLKVESKDGAKYKNPQQLLDKIIGELTFDPLEFCKLEQKEQLKVLLGLLRLEDVLNTLEMKRENIYDERTINNKIVEQMKIQLNVMTKPDNNLSRAKVDTAELVQSLNSANQHNNKIKQICYDFKNLQMTVLYKEYENFFSTLKPLIDKQRMIDIGNINDRIEQSNEINSQIDIAVRYEELQKDYESKQLASSKLTNKLNELETEKKTILSQSKLPIEGLGFDESGVTYNNITFNQCSSAEKLKVSIAMAMALNPKLKIIRIMDGSLLDSAGKKYIKQIAQENDWQIWIEQVADNKGTVGFYIEDGEIK